MAGATTPWCCFRRGWAYVRRRSSRCGLTTSTGAPASSSYAAKARTTIGYRFRPMSAKPGGLHPTRPRIDIAGVVRHRPRAAWPVQGRPGAQHHLEGSIQPHRDEAALPLCRIACPAAQSGNQPGAPGSFVGRGGRHAAPSVTRNHHDLCQARYRRPPLDRAALAGCRRRPMSGLRQELDRYLAVRRSLGYDLGTSARISAASSTLLRARTPSMSAQTCSCAGSRLMGTQMARPGRQGSALYDCSRSGCTASTQPTRCCLAG